MGSIPNLMSSVIYGSKRTNVAFYSFSMILFLINASRQTLILEFSI